MLVNSNTSESGFRLSAIFFFFFIEIRRVNFVLHSEVESALKDDGGQAEDQTDGVTVTKRPETDESGQISSLRASGRNNGVDAGGAQDAEKAGACMRHHDGRADNVEVTFVFSDNANDAFSSLCHVRSENGRLPRRTAASTGEKRSRSPGP